MEMEGNFRDIGIDTIGSLKDWVLGFGIGINLLMIQSDGGLL
jgi:hypothetical protein